MRAIRSRDTRPEMIVRSLIHQMGYRFRLHRRDLPGTPDLVFPRLRKVINVHGCYWHMHNCRFGRVTPKTNAEFWQKKREGNVRRDRRAKKELRNCGWQVMVVWECQTRDLPSLERRLLRFLSDQSSFS
jgi:DNA mismatch endonuclease (patch repair protein)